MPTGQRKFAREDGKYADFLDTNSGNLQPDGTAFIGSSSLAAPSDHIHPGGPYSTVSPYNAANQEGYAAWTWDPNPAYLSNSASFLTISWASGKVGLTRIPVPVALSGLNGYLSTQWRPISGGSPANSYVGLYVLAAGTLTLTGTASSDLTANGYGSRTSTGVTSVAADIGNTTGLFAACLIGTQGTTAGGPIISYAAGSSGPYSRAGVTGACRTLQYGTGLSALPATISLASCSQYLWCNGWFAID